MIKNLLRKIFDLIPYSILRIDNRINDHEHPF